MATTVRVEGLSELIQALKELPKATARNVQQRVLMRRVQPVVDAAKAHVPVRTGRLRDSITATTKRPRGHKTAAARAFAKVRGSGGTSAAAKAASKAAGSSMSEVFVGPGRLAQAGQIEWGNRNHPPHPYMRPAWDAHQRQVLDGIADDMWAEIRKAAARRAKRRMR